MSDTTTDQRVCVTCDEPIVPTKPGNQTRFVHARINLAVDHPAQPKLAHPMDQDPFAGVDGE